MFEVAEKEVLAVVDEMVASLGVREDVPLMELMEVLREKRTREFVEKIASYLSLPIRVDLTAVPDGCSADRGFHSTGLSRTDGTGSGVEAITAQVSIPEWLPLYGTDALTNYRIRVHVSEDCFKYPLTFMTIMAHELSHVLLRSLLHPRRDSEFHTDLVPLVMGFRGIARQGRHITTESTGNGSSVTSTATFGYLTDSQFESACTRIAELLHESRGNKEKLLVAVTNLEHKLVRAKRALTWFYDYLACIDRRRPRQMKQKDAERLVHLHSLSFSGELKESIVAVERELHAARDFADHLALYTDRMVDQLKRHSATLKTAQGQVDRLMKTVSDNTKLLRRHVGPIGRARLAIRGLARRTALSHAD